MTEDILKRAKAERKARENGAMWTEDTDSLYDELMAEVERLRSLLEPVKCDADLPVNAIRARDNYYTEILRLEKERNNTESGLLEDIADLSDEITAKDARIKELEADRIEARAQYLLFLNDNPGCIAWNFDDLEETQQDALREQARYTLKLEEPLALIQLREARERIKELEAERAKLVTLIGMENKSIAGYVERLEAAFLKAEEAVLWDQVVVDGPKEGRAARHIEIVQQTAREALERIKEGQKG